MVAWEQGYKWEQQESMPWYEYLLGRSMKPSAGRGSSEKSPPKYGTILSAYSGLVNTVYITGKGGWEERESHLRTEVDVLCQRAVGEGILKMVGVHTGAMGDHINVM